MSIRYFIPFILFSLLCSASIHLSAQKAANEADPSTARYQGLLWEITGKGITRPSYLYGTMHVPEKLAFNLSDSFFIAMRGVDMVALETDHELWQAFTQNMRDDMEQMRNGKGSMQLSELSTRLNNRDLYGRDFKFDTPGKDIFSGMFSYKPVMTNEFLYRSNEYRQDYEEDTYLDLFIFQAGKKLGKTVIGLESMEGSYEMVTRARIPDDKKEEEEAEEREYIAGDKITDAYRRQDLNTLDSLNRKMSPGKNFRKWMLEERNVIMANGIDSIAQAGKAIFSAVGAAHLPGDIGVIEQLRRKGYTVRPVTFTPDKDRKSMSEIENLRFPMSFSTQIVADSAWSVAAPGKFYNTSEGTRIKQALCADMNNGAYYAIYRIQTYGLWAGQAPEYISSRIDSLIYEKVPGKILERKQLTTPFEGHEIMTRTRHGDILRYKIFVTPLEVIMFIAGGTRDYMNGPEGNQFINSIRYVKNATAAPQYTLKPPTGGFQLRFPAPMIANTSNEQDPAVLYAAAVDTTSADKAFYFFFRNDYHDLNYIEEDTFELNIIGEKLAAQFTTKSPVMQLVQTAPYPTQDIQFTADADSARYFARIVIDGPRYYLLGCRKRSADMPTAFFNAFEIKPDAYPAGFELYRDTILHCTYQQPVDPAAESNGFLYKLRKIGEEAMQKQRKNNAIAGEDAEDNTPKRFGRNLVFGPTGEMIRLTANNVFSTQDYPDMDSLKRELTTMLAESKSLILHTQKWDMVGDTMLIGNFVAGDTNSLRLIKTRIVVRRHARFFQQTVVQKDQPESQMVQNLFNSFMPYDTAKALPLVFGEHQTDFVADLFSTDSITRRTAREQLREQGPSQFKKGDFSVLKNAVLHPDFEKLKFSDRSILLSALGFEGSPAAEQLLHQFYITHSDSVRYAEHLLDAMLNIKTQSSVNQFFEWLEQKPSYINYSMDAFAGPLSDSLALLVPLAPALSRLAQYGPTESFAKTLLNMLVNNKMIRPKAYTALKPHLLADAHYGLDEIRFKAEQKRERAGNEENEDYHDYGESGNGYGVNLSETMLLLAPFIHKDKDVKAFFEKALRFGDEDTRLEVYGIYLQNGIPVAPATLKTFADADLTRFDLFRTLAYARQLRSYTGWFSDTLSMARSLLYGRLGENQAPDSVRLISRHKTLYDAQPAELFFFDVKQKKEKKYIMASVIIPSDYGLSRPLITANFAPTAQTATAAGLGYISSYSWVKVLQNINTEKEKTEYIRKKIGEIRFAARQRYKNSERGGYE